MPSTSTPPPEKEPKQTMEEAIADATLLMARQTKAEAMWSEVPSYERLLKLTTAQLARLDLWDKQWPDHYIATLLDRIRNERAAYGDASRGPEFSRP